MNTTSQTEMPYVVFLLNYTHFAFSAEYVQAIVELPRLSKCRVCRHISGG